MSSVEALILGTAGHAYMVNMDSVVGWVMNCGVTMSERQEEENWSHGDQLGVYLMSNLLLNHSFIHSCKKRCTKYNMMYSILGSGSNFPSVGV